MPIGPAFLFRSSDVKHALIVSGTVLISAFQCGGCYLVKHRGQIASCRSGYFSL